MKKKMFKQGLFSLVALFLVFTNVSVPVSASPSSPPSSPSEYAYIDGEKVFLEREVKDGFSRGIVKNEKGEVISEVSINLNANEAILDGVKLSDEEFQEIVELGQEELTESLNLNNDLESTPVVSKMTGSPEISTLAACTYKKIGSTKKRSTWIPKTGVAAVAAAISIAIPSVGWASAVAIAGVVAGSTNTLYYTVTEYSCYSGGYYHLRTTRKFYKKSNYTGHIKTVHVYGKRR